VCIQVVRRLSRIELSMRANELFTVAGSLSGSEPYERSAVSRYYYGCHHEAREVFALNPPKGRSTHRFVIDQLRGTRNQAGHNRAAGHLLNSLRAMRNRADYEIDQPWPASEVADAQRLIARFRKLIGTVP